LGARLNSLVFLLGRRMMTALRDYNAAVDFVNRNVAEGRGDKTAFIDPFRNLTYAERRDCNGPHRTDAGTSVPRQDSIFRSIPKLKLGRPLPGERAPMWRAAAYLKFCVNWRWAC
jgi:hypothetical protein